MKKLLFIIALILFALPCYAADYYIAQTAAGSGNGSSCANADAIADLTWGPGNMVTAGDTLHLCGTLTSTLTIGASGSSGSVITIIFEAGAKFSKAYWGTTTSAAIASAGKNYITIDGNNAGIIENTDNGTALTNQQNSAGIYINGGSNVTIKNLTIQNMYVRTTDSADTGATTSDSVRGISADSTSGILIYGNTITYCRYGIIVLAESSAIDAAKIYSNTMPHNSAGIVVAASATGYDITNAEIYSNVLSDGHPWNSGTQIFHNDGIHMWQNASGKIISVSIYKNTFSGDWGADTTGMVFLEGNISSALVYNNLFAVSTIMPAEGYIDIGTGISGTLAIYNNTLKGLSTSSVGKYGAYVQTANWSSVTVKNNIFNTFYAAINIRDTQDITSDYNNFYNNGNVAVRHNAGSDQVASYWSLDLWKANLGGCPGTGNECASVETDPHFVSSSDFHLTATSTEMIGGATPLNATFTDDLAGTVRGVAWDIGAYEYGEDAPDPDYNLTVTLVNNGAGESVSFSPVGTSCGDNCRTYDTGTSVTVTAAHPDNRKEVFTGDGTAGVVIVDAAKAITVTFSNLTGQGTIGSSGGGATVSRDGTSGGATITR